MSSSLMTLEWWRLQNDREDIWGYCLTWVEKRSCDCNGCTNSAAYWEEPILSFELDLAKAEMPAVSIVRYSCRSVGKAAG